MIAVDTNILVSAHREDSSFHDAAARERSVRGSPLHEPPLHWVIVVGHRQEL
jgi:predicted nucleic acid-binding protein